MGPVETPPLPAPSARPPHAVMHEYTGGHPRAQHASCPVPVRGQLRVHVRRATLSCHYRAVPWPTAPPSVQERRARRCPLPPALHSVPILVLVMRARPPGRVWHPMSVAALPYRPPATMIARPYGV